MFGFHRPSLISSAVFSLALSSCIGGGSPSDEARVEPSLLNPQACTSTLSAPIPSGSTGVADVFLVDPSSSAGDPAISPASSTLGNYTSRVTLEHLLGQGILKGAYVEVVSGYCAQRPGAYDAQNRFVYEYGDGRFAETMSYYHGDRYRTRLDEAGVLLPTAPVRIIANCAIQDNAYYTQDLDEQGNVIDKVCMGLSSRFAAGNLSHDAQVVIHELQHAATTHSYSPVEDMNRFYYDDAGSINEGISDFVALMLTEEFIPSSFDFRIFSRWALGALLPNQARGIARCPVYDSDYPNCGHFSASSSGFSSEENHVSFSYPDGLGWPVARNQGGPAFVKNHFTSNRSIEQIHQNGAIASGTLWDSYVNLKEILSIPAAQAKMLKLVTETLATLPKPNASVDLSPVTYPALGEKLVETSALLGWSDSERAALKAATDARGLTSLQRLEANWAARGPGKLQTPGLHVIDSSDTGGQSNGKLNRGDYAAVFFDIQNNSSLTAGSVLLDVMLPTSSVVFLGRMDNEGYVSDSRAMIRYGKVNGTAIVNALSSANSTWNVPTSNTYFKTNPHYANSVTMTTPLYVYVPESAATGPTYFRVRIKPANGPEVTLDFPVEVHP